MKKYCIDCGLPLQGEGEPRCIHCSEIAKLKYRVKELEDLVFILKLREKVKL